MRFYRVLAFVLIILTGFWALADEIEAAPTPTPLPEAFGVEYLTAESALLVDMDTMDVLYSRNSKVRMYPASTTKIMTLLLALESGIGLDEVITIPAEAGDVPENSSVIPVYPGDEMTWRDLLYGFMLNSGNDGANAIAVLAEGGVKAFVARMNARAEAVGCTGTHFVNAHGYHDGDHYTTAQDLARISLEAMKNPDFREIVAAPRWDMTITRKGETVTQRIDSRVSLLIEGQKYYYPACTGIKTGHTGKAGYCFVGSASRDGVNLLAVVLKCPEDLDKFYDAARLWEYGFARYEPVPLENILAQAAPRLSATIEDAEGDGTLGLNIGQMTVSGEGTLMINPEADGAMDAAVAEAAEAYRIEWSRPLTAPIAAGETLGTLLWETPRGTVSAPLTASRDVAARATEAPTAEPREEVTDAPGEAAEDGPEAADGPVEIPPVALLAGALILVLAAVLIVLAARRREKRRRRRRRRGRRVMGKR